VTFVESVHGFGRATGFAALPGRWQFALVVALLAALLLLASRARRLGPAELAGDEPTPARREHVDALAPVREAARAQVIRSAALDPGASDDEIRDAALRLGLEEDEVAALTQERGVDDVRALGRALARGRR
jgi:hypothetical protein